MPLGMSQPSSSRPISTVSSTFLTSLQPSQSPSALKTSQIHHKMDPNITPTDSESDADQRGTSPGGARPVEEPVEPRAPTTPEAHVPAEQDELPAVPEIALPPPVEYEEDGFWVDLPEELHGLAGRLQGPIEFELDDQGVARLRDPNFDPAFAEDALALARHVQALPQFAAQQPRETDANVWEHTRNQMLQTLAPAQRTVIQNFVNATNALWRDLVENPARADRDTPAVLDFLENTVALRRTMLSLSDEAVDIIGVYLDEAGEQIGRLLANPNIRNPEDIDALRENVAPLLDSLINTNLAQLGSDVPQHDSTKCTVCLEDYAESDGIVVLPCHPTHHFHRTCIHDWLQTLIPGAPTCPNCRAPIFALNQPGTPPQ
ncbi:hypothetical protein PGTUg99_033485 [Puccinia graminis f. sp. tritici]|uniref:RING-type domain-containing protein n=2 Tax=Puccinia graminis f. sp. tritici TaxID=56615 RepID=A0A5B0Q8W7_PUCGR|nr:hypothetical protein PGTUg99_033485 [Puccinia graminis f. sp. tritici]